MAAPVIVEQSFTTVGSTPYFTYTGTWTHGSADANASPGNGTTGGTYDFSVTAGDHFVLTVPANNGRFVLMHCTAGGNARLSSVSVDGIAQPNWSQSNNDFSATAGIMYRTCYPPIDLAAFSGGVGASHTITVTYLSGGAITIDKAEFYTAQSPVAGRILVGGHSIAAGYNGSADVTPRVGSILAGALGPAYTEVMNALDGESLAQGQVVGNGTWLGGGTDTTDGVVANLQPGWARLIDPHTNWADQLPEIAIIWWGINDARQRGTNDPASSAGYGMNNFVQRLREACWKLLCNCPTCQIYVLGIGYVTHTTTTGGYTATGTTAFQHGSEATSLAWNTAIAAMCNESSMMGQVQYVGTYNSIAGPNDGVLIAPATDGVHMTTQGHYIIAQAILKRHLAITRATTGLTL